MKRYLALDIGGTNVKYGIIDNCGNILMNDKFPTNKNKQEFYKDIKSLVEKLENEYEIAGIGVSVPGIVNTKEGKLVTAGALHEMYGCYFKKELEELTGLKVAMENDVNCVALAEKWLGNGKDCENFICMAIGTGIGGAIVVNDRIYRGSKYMAGEFGFMISKEVEDQDVRMATLSMTSSTYFGIIDTYKSMAGIADDIDGEYVFEKYENGDKIAVEVFKGFYKRIGIAIFNLIFSLDPEKVLIGGAISNNKRVMSEIRKAVKEIKEQHIDMRNLTLPEIEACKFTNDSGIIGAVYNFINENLK